MLLRILIIYGVLSLASNAIILYLMWKAPRGHEDEETGYHED